MRLLTEPKPLPFKEGDEVELFYLQEYSKSVYTIKSRIYRIKETVIWVCTPNSTFGAIPIRREYVFTNFEEAKEALITSFYERINEILSDIEMIHDTNTARVIIP